MPDGFYSWLAWSLFSLMLPTLAAGLLFWKALEASGLKLRDETNLKSITEEMVLAIHDTRRPNYVGLWRLPKVRT
ncbi:MAG: hypothetical protein H0U04_07005 [Rubrobacter sp.]|nr:hypothetical protein [Rubrobacter sp.]